MDSQDAPAEGAAVASARIGNAATAARTDLDAGPDGGADSASASAADGAADTAGPARAAFRARVPAAERHMWALAALLVPLLFTTMVAVGVVLMLKRHMAFFRPAPSGALTLAPPCACGATPHQDGAASEANPWSRAAARTPAVRGARPAPEARFDSTGPPRHLTAPLRVAVLP